jgi:signal transduction histidine kinase
MSIFVRVPFVARVPLVAALLMVLMGIIASQQVLLALNRVQDDRIRELATLHVEALSVALGPYVLRQDVWEVYDTLTRASGQGDGRRIAFTAVAGMDGVVLAATDPARAPIGADMAALADGAALPSELTILPDARLLRLAAPLIYQGREVGQLVTELVVTDLLSNRLEAGRLLIFGNAAATLILALAGYFATRRMLRPVQSLAHHMGASGDSPVPFAPDEIPSGDNELSRLFHIYNRMAAAVGERNQAERRLAERERFVSLGRLSSSLAHEINNPLGGLMTAADTIREYADRPEVVRQSADLLIRGLEHLGNVARATLDMNRLDRQDKPLTPEDLQDLRTLIGPELRRHTQKLDWNIFAGAKALSGLPAAPVRQVMLNLLLNASAVAGQAGHVGLSVTEEGAVLRITVEDSGPGLTPDARRRLMSDATLPPGGGLGLRLVHDLVEEYGGLIEVAHLEGKTSISVQLPRQETREGAGA